MIDETPMAKYRVTVDTGGTFSDFVFFNEDTGEISITKVPSTPKEPFQAVLNGVKELVDQGRSGARHFLFSVTAQRLAQTRCWKKKEQRRACSSPKASAEFTR